MILMVFFLLGVIVFVIIEIRGSVIFFVDFVNLVIMVFVVFLDWF